MKYSKKYFPVGLPLLFVLLTTGYFFTRLYALKSLPIFGDEAIYIHWAQLGFFNANLRLTSLGDGKQPLFIWLIIIVMHVVHNPLVAGRVVSILAGFATEIGVALLSFELFRNKWVSLLSMILYILTPFGLIYDRLALYDSLVTALALWTMYGGILLAKKVELVYALLLAFPMGAGILNKSSGLFSIYLLPLTLFLFDWGKKALGRLAHWMLYAALAVSISYIYYSVVFLSTDSIFITSKNGLFLNSPDTLLHSSWLPLFFSNTVLFSEWIVLLFTPFFLLLVVVSILSYKEFTKEKVLLLSTFIIEIISFALLGRTINPRYIFFMTIYLIPLASLGLWYLCNRYKKNTPLLIGIIIICFSFALYSDYKILTNLEEAPVPSITKFELVTGWDAGTGNSDVIKYLLTQSRKQQIFIVTDSVWGGLAPSLVDIYFFGNPNVKRTAVDDFSHQIPALIVEKAKTESVYLYMNTIQKPPLWPADLIMKIQKGHGLNYVFLYKLRSV